MAAITEIADAVATALNDGEFSQDFEAVRHYLPTFELEEMKELHVTVVPRGVSISLLGRVYSQFDYRIDVAIQKRFEEGNPAQLDPLMTLVEEIADFFRFKRLPGEQGPMWVHTENAPIYAQEHMEQFRQFTSLLTFTFRTQR